MADQGIKDFVSALYDVHLDRAPEPTGLDYWSNAIASGAMSQEAVANAIANSAEAKIADIYQSELGRSGEGDPGVGYWASAVESGQMTLAEAQNAIARSQEGAAYDVNRLYQSELGRAADDPGAQYWRDALMSGRLDEAGLLSGIRGSQEYRGVTQTPGTTTTTAFNADKLRAQMEADFAKQLAAQKAAYEKQLAEQTALRAQQQRTLQQSMQGNMMQNAVNNAAAGSFTPTAPLSTAGTTSSAGTTGATAGLPAAAPVAPAEITPAPTMYVPQTYLSPAPPQYRGYSPFQVPFGGPTANPFESYFAIAQRRLPGMPPSVMGAPPGSVPQGQSVAGPYIPVDGSTAGQAVAGPPPAYAFYSPFAPFIQAGPAPAPSQAPTITNPVLPPTA